MALHQWSLRLLVTESLVVTKIITARTLPPPRHAVAARAQRLEHLRWVQDPTQVLQPAAQLALTRRSWRPLPQHAGWSSEA